MNKQIKELLEQCNYVVDGTCDNSRELKLIELVMKECAEFNKRQSYNLMGVIYDTEEGDGFDDVCLMTTKNVCEYLSTGLTEAFSPEENNNNE